jgi:hypothetical protein
MFAVFKIKAELLLASASVAPPRCFLPGGDKRDRRDADVHEHPGTATRVIGEPLLVVLPTESVVFTAWTIGKTTGRGRQSTGRLGNTDAH